MLRECTVFILALLSLGLAPNAIAEKKPIKLKLIRDIPHQGYSEGLSFYQGYLWHALPKAILKIDPKDGSTVKTYVPATDYSESLTWFQGKLWNVSFKNNGLYATPPPSRSGGKLAFVRKGNVPEKHAWGLTHNGKQLIVTGNYSSTLYFLNPKTLSVERTITVPVKDVEDLAWDGKGLWSSSFTTHRGQIFWINPKDGQISSFYSLPDPEACPVVDGIAFDGKGLWITGKQCPRIYYVKRPKF